MTSPDTFLWCVDPSSRHAFLIKANGYASNTRVRGDELRVLLAHGSGPGREGSGGGAGDRRDVGKDAPTKHLLKNRHLKTDRGGAVIHEFHSAGLGGVARA